MTTGGDSADAPPLVSAQWLGENLSVPDVVLLQVDGDAGRYHQRHLPTALSLDWQDDLHEPVRRGPVAQPRLEALLAGLGITRDTHVVLYGSEEPVYAAHAYWLLRYYRHPRLSLLDGGQAAWVAAGLPLDDVAVVPRRRTAYRSPGPDATVRSGRDDVLRRVADPGVLLLDCRSGGEFTGRRRHPLDLPVDRHRVVGHIPGARNVHWQGLLRRDGRFRAGGELAGLLARVGLRGDSDVIVYCRTAERSSLVWFALHELLGHRSVRLYDGGWAEYGSLVDVPVARHGLF